MDAEFSNSMSTSQNSQRDIVIGEIDPQRDIAARDHHSTAGRANFIRRELGEEISSDSHNEEVRELRQDVRRMLAEMANMKVRIDNYQRQAGTEDNRQGNGESSTDHGAPPQATVWPREQDDERNEIKTNDREQDMTKELFKLVPTYDGTGGI